MLIIEPSDVALFTVKIGPHEEIRPVAAGGKHVGKFMIQDDIASGGKKYAAEAAKPHYATKTKSAPILDAALKK